MSVLNWCAICAKQGGLRAVASTENSPDLGHFDPLAECTANCTGLRRNVATLAVFSQFDAEIWHRRPSNL